MTCIFCKIASGEIPSEKVIENERAFAFLDVKPLVKGHVLVIPKRHAERVTDMPPEDASAVMELAQHVIRRLEGGMGIQGVTVAFNDGRPAGQEVLHAHMHIVPRSETDGVGPIHRLFKAQARLREGELREIGVRLRG
ncbi:MAG: HIT family protein [Candidatus Thermoplasmatota archaeon]